MDLLPLFGAITLPLPMKAERRHELQTNSLALWLKWRAPELWKKFGNWVLLGVIVLCLAIVLIRRQINAPREAARAASEMLTQAREGIMQLEMGVRTPGESTTVQKLIRDSLDRSDAPDVQALGHLSLFDYYWALATYPVPPEASSQPSLRPEETQDVLLDKAEQALDLAIKDQSTNGGLIGRALLGRAYVAELRASQADRSVHYKSTTQSAQWAIARDRYQAVISNPKVPPLLQDEARRKLALLPTLQRPVYLAPPPVESTTAPAGPLGPMLPTTGATTRPAIGATTRTTLPTH